MINLSKKEIEKFSNKILENYHNKVPSSIFKDKKEQAKKNNFLRIGNLILTGAYGFPVPINEKKLIEVSSSAFGDVEAKFI